MQTALDVVSRPFAVFFAEAFDEARQHRRALTERARLPLVQNDEEPRLGLCVECLRPQDACSCD